MCTAPGIVLILYSIFLSMLYFFTALLLVIVFLAVYIIFLPQWGAAPSGSRLQRIVSSPQYNGKEFQNFSHTPNFAEGWTMGKVMRRFMFTKVPNKVPPRPIQVKKMPISPREFNQPVITWFGHSSYLLQLQGINILVDPVFGTHASPLPMGPRAFNGTSVYSAADMPDIDVLLITHDHYDHLDYPAIKSLLPKVKKVVTSLGVGAHLEKWGADASIIQELDWWEDITLFENMKFTATPSRHFSGRGLKRNITLWSSFVLETGKYTLYLGGDSGYDSHFKKIGERWPHIDLAILESGQYNEAWHYIHMLPHEVVQAAQDLGCKKFMPVHWGKFALAMHGWNESIEQVAQIARTQQLPFVTAHIGESFSPLQERDTQDWWNLH